MAAQVRGKYRGLSREKLLQKVYDLGAAYEIHSFSCSQSTVAALYRVLDFPDALVKAASSNAAGTAMQLVGTCGGLVGGIMVLDSFFGRPFEHMSDNEVIQDPNRKLEEAGAHSNPEKCPRIVGNAARWTMEILLDNGAVKLG